MNIRGAYKKYASLSTYMGQFNGMPSVKTQMMNDSLR